MTSAIEARVGITIETEIKMFKCRHLLRCSITVIYKHAPLKHQNDNMNFICCITDGTTNLKMLELGSYRFRI